MLFRSPILKIHKYLLLMPTIATLDDPITLDSLEDEPLHRLILSDDNKVFINVPYTLNAAHEDGVFKHTCKLGPTGEILELSDEEQRRLFEHSPICPDYFEFLSNAYKERHNGVAAKPALRKLIAGLRAGGQAVGGYVRVLENNPGDTSYLNMLLDKLLASSTLSAEVQQLVKIIDAGDRSPDKVKQLVRLLKGGVGKSERAGYDANVAIAEFAETLAKIKQFDKAGYDHLMNNGTFNDYWGRLINPSRKASQSTRYCVEVIAGNLEPVLNRMPGTSFDERQYKRNLGIWEQQLENSLKSPLPHTSYNIEKDFVHVKCVLSLAQEYRLVETVFYDLDSFLPFFKDMPGSMRLMFLLSAAAEVFSWLQQASYASFSEFFALLCDEDMAVFLHELSENGFSLQALCVDAASLIVVLNLSQETVFKQAVLDGLNPDAFVEIIRQASLAELASLFRQIAMLNLQNFEWLGAFIVDSIVSYAATSLQVQVQLCAQHFNLDVTPINTACEIGDIDIMTRDQVLDLLQSLPSSLRYMCLQKLGLLQLCGLFYIEKCVEGVRYHVLDVVQLSQVLLDLSIGERLAVLANLELSKLFVGRDLVDFIMQTLLEGQAGEAVHNVLSLFLPAQILHMLKFPGVTELLRTYYWQNQEVPYDPLAQQFRLLCFAEDILHYREEKKVIAANFDDQQKENADKLKSTKNIATLFVIEAILSDTNIGISANAKAFWIINLLQSAKKRGGVFSHSSLFNRCERSVLALTPMAQQRPTENEARMLADIERPILLKQLMLEGKVAPDSSLNDVRAMRADEFRARIHAAT